MKPVIVIVNAPKGGVGKTTTAVNLTLLLGKEGKKVLGYDIAQGTFYTERIKAYKKNIIVITDELKNEVSNDLKIAIKNEKPEYIIVDTDDYFGVFFELYEKCEKISSKVILLVPFVNGFEERARIVLDFSKIAQKEVLGNGKMNIVIFQNKASKKATKVSKEIQEGMQDSGIGRYLTNNVVCNGYKINAPYFIDDQQYYKQLKTLWEEDVL